jgi:hypothetical protein
MVEEVVFSPRLIPLSMKEPMRKICCGARFVLALTQVIFIFILKTCLLLSIIGREIIFVGSWRVWSVRNRESNKKRYS